MNQQRIFRVAAVVAPRVPMWLARPLARLLGVLIWAFARGTRRRVERNLRHIPRLATDPVALTHAARGVFEHMVLNYLDFLRGRDLTDEQVLAGWTTQGLDELDATMREGRGAVVLTGHFGNFEYGASRLGALGYQLVAPVERIQPEQFFQWFRQMREHHNLRLLPADRRETLREMVDALKRNEMVLVVGDRHIIGSSIELPFFGEPARLPTSGAALALKTGAPLFAAFSWRTGPGRSHGVIIPLDVAEARATEGAGARAGRRGESQALFAEATAQVMRRFVAQLERVIQARPEQWVSALANVWDLQSSQESAGQAARPSTDGPLADMRAATAYNESAR